MSSFKYFKALYSPFKPFKIRVYFGKTTLGVPYFLPRKWVKATPKLAHKATLEQIENDENFNKRNPDYARKIKPYEEIYQEKLRYEYPIPRKIGFDYCDLGWKTKWDDYRFEWAPRLSFVAFGYQIALTVVAPHADHYWESWLYYEKDTDKTKSKRERIEQCRKEAPQTWTRHKNDGTKETIDYYELILRKKYLKIIKSGGGIG